MTSHRKVEELREHRDALIEFERDYREYIDAQRGDEPGYAGRPGWLGARRADLLRRAARAQRAVDASGFPFALTPPPAFGGPILHNLAQQIFAHETSLYGGGPDPFLTADMVLDMLGNAIGSLDDAAEQAARADHERSASMAGRASQSASRHLPSIWRRLHPLPTWIGFAADVVTVVSTLVVVVGVTLGLIGVL